MSASFLAAAGVCGDWVAGGDGLSGQDRSRSVRVGCSNGYGSDCSGSSTGVQPPIRENSLAGLSAALGVDCPAVFRAGPKAGSRPAVAAASGGLEGVCPWNCQPFLCVCRRVHRRGWGAAGTDPGRETGRCVTGPSGGPESAPALV